MRRVSLILAAVAVSSVLACSERSSTGPASQLIVPALTASRGELPPDPCRSISGEVDRFLALLPAVQRREIARRVDSQLRDLLKGRGHDAREDGFELLQILIAARPVSDEASSLLATLVRDVFACLEIDVPNIDPSSFGAGGAIGIALPGQRTRIATGDDNAGAIFQPGSVNVPVLVTITPIGRAGEVSGDGAAAVIASGVLAPARLPEYGPAYRYQTYPETRFSKPVTVGIREFIPTDTRPILGLAHTVAVAGLGTVAQMPSGVACPQLFLNGPGATALASRAFSVAAAVTGTSVNTTGCASSFSPWVAVNLRDLFILTGPKCGSSTFTVSGPEKLLVNLRWRTDKPALDGRVRYAGGPVSFTPSIEGRPVSVDFAQLLFKDQVIAVTPPDPCRG
ncbi:MAG: hypothetical protein ABJD07_16365 [Gemmatimonadaceae bacterium]